MRPDYSRWMPLASLVAMSVVAGVVWRLELELRWGWASLNWLQPFHWAVPLGVLGFAVWTCSVAKGIDRLGLALRLLVFFPFGLLGAWICLYVWFAQGTAAMALVMAIGGKPGWSLALLKGMAVIGWAAMPLLFGSLLRRAKVFVGRTRLLASVLLFMLAWPLAAFVRGFVEDRGGQDAIHALKSGFVIPFLVFALGWLVLPCPATECSREPRPPDQVSER